MEQYVIRGGNPLVGEVEISGAKNAALGILAASIMTDENVIIENLPDVRDINVMLEAIQEIGARVERTDRHTVKINASTIHEVSVDDDYMRRIRASYYFIGALLGKYKSAEVPLPGGCRPYPPAAGCAGTVRYGCWDVRSSGVRPGAFSRCSLCIAYHLATWRNWAHSARP